MSHPRPVRQIRRIGRIFAVLTLAGLLAAACGEGDEGASGDEGRDSAEKETLVVYSGREQELVEPLYEAFERETGIEVDVRYGDSAALAAQIAEEGDNSPADVFYAQDAGAIGSVNEQLAELPGAVLEPVQDRFRDPEARWVGVTARVRALVYNTDRVKPADLPDSIDGVLEPAWKGRVGVAPTNASFVAWVSALRTVRDDAGATMFLKGLVANDARSYEKNGAIVDAVAKGEVDLGLVNHYYLYEKLGQDPQLPIANHFFVDGDVGNLVNVSAVGVLSSSEQESAARTFVEYLLDEGQTFIVEDLAEREYPVVELDGFADSERYRELPALEGIKGPADIDLGALGAQVESTVQLITESGLDS